MTVPVAALALLISLFLRELPLREMAPVNEAVTDVVTDAPAEAFETPRPVGGN